MQAVSQNEQFLELLKQIQSMESLEQIREAIQIAIRTFAPDETQALRFGGEAGNPFLRLIPTT